MAHAEKVMLRRVMKKRHRSLNDIKKKDSNPTLSYEDKNFYVEEGIENIQRYFDFCGHMPRQF